MAIHNVDVLTFEILVLTIQRVGNRIHVYILPTHYARCIQVWYYGIYSK